MRLGIDFGTTRTVVAAVHEGRYPVVSFETGGAFVEYLPGIASVDSQGVHFGTEASCAARPTLRSVKARITGAMPDEAVQETSTEAGPLSALALTRDYLKYVARMIREQSNLELADDEPLEVMIAVPAHANTRQRYLTIEAFQSAGFTVLGLLNEPTAAAVEYARHSLSALSSRSPKRYVIVYDLGGGTFDTAAVSLKERRFELIGAEGVSSLGGNDIDRLIAEQLLSQLPQPRSWEELDDLAQNALLESCRMAKESLSANSRKILVEGLQGLGPDDLLLELAPVYEAAQPLIERSLAAMESLVRGLQAHGIDPENSRELGAIYLVGGSVQFPAVQKALREKFGRKIQLAPQPHASTAIGLAIAADEDAGIFVREAPTRHFGVWREAEGGREKIFDPIIMKKHGAAQEEALFVERIYRPAHAVGRLRFVECTDLDANLRPGGEVTPWQSILFPYDPALKEQSDLDAHLESRLHDGGSEEIVETYEYQNTGVIRVQIENRTRGYHREFVLGQA